MTSRIGFVGLGHMGSPIAENLIRSGHSLRIFNRTSEKVAPFVEMGAEQAATPADAASPGGIVFSMIANDRVMEIVTLEEHGILERLGKGGVHVSMSTLSPALARKLEKAHRERGAEYVAAPVFGRPEAAAARKLWICVAGAAGARARVRPLMEELGQGVFEVGDEPAEANVVKLANNFLIAAAMEAMAEAFTLGEKNGVPREKLAEIVGKTLFACPIYQGYGKAIAEERFEPAGFGLMLGLKDVKLALDTAEESQVPMPLAQLVHGRLLSAMARGRGKLDWAALALGAKEDAGLGEQ
ncbi:NAD(P)-dependent oxidoreductase [Vulgatibacter incomptus]|uniref:6-phosphogluconate dehydrogenase, NAD-binding n=1 Tax=Vulgatibacter incomptus TaxID=1391653 RepID=A0A0K1PG19_9BACT|nr:NAD(P)-dependent oxidoreductase [Vulgatibacter incomptus]AKU92452.1 6-phosphogluconate dehydrogenase, NAD-binding [Vulgatibacter incomptus]